jgi:DNA-binding transcriptional LysR family regulator
MCSMNWGAFDLNLLIVFDAVMQERSVTRAGSRIGLSQPAMSHALNRLRYMLKDELFVRTPDGMAPTPRAETLAQPLRNALSEMQLALEPTAFDPAASDRRFSLAVNNYAAVVLVPPLVAAVSAAAPAVRLDLRPSGTLDLVERLDRGDLDLTLGGPAPRFTVNGSSDGRFAMRNLLFAGTTGLSLALGAAAAFAATSSDAPKPDASQLVEGRAAYMTPVSEFGQVGNDFGPGFNFGERQGGGVGGIPVEAAGYRAIRRIDLFGGH